MTLFAGVFSRHEGNPIPDSVCDDLTRLISRDKTDSASTFKDPRCFIAKIDIGAFSGTAFRIDDDGSVSALAGEPLVQSDDKDQTQSRTRDLELLHESWKQEDWSVLVNTRGVFSAAHYQPQTGKLFLIADKLCIRPLYLWADEEFVIFATALRILEDLDAVPKTMDVRGVTEVSGLGYPLGSRTPYVGISLLNAAEIVRVENTGIARDRYWRWDQIEPSLRNEEELLSDLHATFMRAVSLRIGEDKTTIAYLSGGLDSRCAVAALLDVKTRVHTFNFALPDTQDYVFGNEFAAQTGTIHQSVPKEHGDLTPDYSELMRRAWDASPQRVVQPAERPSVVWSGEGGSVALGHVHLGAEVVDLMRADQPDKAVDAFLLQEQASVTNRLLNPAIRDRMASALHVGICEELSALEGADPARNFYLFLILNDQRRKLAAHFENIDLHRHEFQLPFFDSAFLSVIVSLPIDQCLRHKLYLKWLKLFSPVVSQVPWQAYPGHEPCPIPVEQSVAYQWDSTYQDQQATALKAELLEQANQMLRARDFPDEILSKKYLRIAALIYRSGLRDYSYVIQAAWKYFSYWKLCAGKYVSPSRLEDSGTTVGDALSDRFATKPGLTQSSVK